MATDDSAFEGWCVLELMGHRRLAGYVRGQELAGHAFVRIDVPEVDGQAPATQFYSPAAVYCITPTTETLAREVARSSRPAPVSRWELPKLVAAPDARDPDDDPEDDDRPDYLR